MAAKRAASLPTHDPSARERLLHAAIDVFNRKGYAAASVREIVEGAGVTKPVLYYYFANKEGLFQELMNQVAAQFNGILEKAHETEGSARSRIEGLCGDAFALFKRNIPLVRVVNSLYYGPPQGSPPIDVDQHHRRFHERLKGLLAQGRRLGEFQFQKTEDAMWAIIGVLNIATEVELCHPEMALGPKDLKRVLGIVFRGIEPEPRVTAPRPGRKEKGTKR